MPEDTAAPDARPDDELFEEARATRPALDQITDKWSVMILTVVCARPARFNAIRRRVGGITHKVLTEALRRLERNGLLARRVIATSPVAVEYSITPLGRSLQPSCSALYAWALAHAGDVTAAQARYDRDRRAEERGARVVQRCMNLPCPSPTSAPSAAPASPSARSRSAP